MSRPPAAQVRTNGRPLEIVVDLADETEALQLSSLASNDDDASGAELTRPAVPAPRRTGTPSRGEQRSAGEPRLSRPTGHNAQGPRRSRVDVVGASCGHRQLTPHAYSAIPHRGTRQRVTIDSR